MPKRMTYLELLKAVRKNIANEINLFVCTGAANVLDCDEETLKDVLFSNGYKQLYDFIMRIGKKYNKDYAWEEQWFHVRERKRRLSILDKEIKRMTMKSGSKNEKH